MRWLPRRVSEVRPLDPGVESLLRGLTHPEPPPMLRARVLAAAAQRRPEPAPGWGFRLVLGGVAVAAAAVVVLVANPAGGRAAAALPAWETVHPSAPVAARPVRVVDDPTMPGLPSTSLVAFDPLDGP